MHRKALIRAGKTTDNPNFSANYNSVVYGGGFDNGPGAATYNR
jgi:hypothetical protein